MHTLFPAPAWHILCVLANGQAPQKSLYNVPTCLMSLKEEGTHNHDFKINSRRQSTLVLGSTLCWWSHLLARTAATAHLEASEVWQWLVLLAEGLFTEGNLHFNHSHNEAGARPWASTALPWAFPLLICLPIFLSSLFLRWDRETPLSSREALQWVCQPIQPKMLGRGLVVLQCYSNQCTKAAS